jgi:5-methylthioribose kinase
MIDPEFAFYGPVSIIIIMAFLPKIQRERKINRENEKERTHIIVYVFLVDLDGTHSLRLVDVLDFLPSDGI